MTDSSTSASIDPAMIDAVIFDMDGVLTDTARLHVQAWQETFDEVLRVCADRDGSAFRPFTMNDYRRYVDGKPREAGVHDFLTSRGIELPPGSVSAADDALTEHAIGRRKNARFRALLADGNVTAFDDAIDLLLRLERARIKVAAISSSRNASAVLDAAGLLRYFPVLIDGQVAATRGIDGKPAPDIFLEAARLLGVNAERAAVVEDATAGVRAGRAGRFGLVIGVARNGDADALHAAGAHVVVSTLKRVTIAPIQHDRASLPDALAAIDPIVSSLGGRRVHLYLDYDGTLTPIVSRPEDATLSDAMRATLERAAQSAFVAIVSGRGLDDLKARAGLDGVVYAGSHGFEICHADGSLDERSEAHDALPALDDVERDLQQALASIDGVQFERKRFGLAVHYRRAAPADAEAVQHAVRRAQAQHSNLRVKAGKMVFEFVPGIDWHKGRALTWIRQRVDPEEHAVPVYLGDDVTDEDAFRVLADGGVAIAVGEGPARTYARWKLTDVGAVALFIDRVTRHDRRS